MSKTKQSVDKRSYSTIKSIIRTINDIPELFELQKRYQEAYDPHSKDAIDLNKQVFEQFFYLAVKEENTLIAIVKHHHMLTTAEKEELEKRITTVMCDIGARRYFEALEFAKEKKKEEGEEYFQKIVGQSVQEVIGQYGISHLVFALSLKGARSASKKVRERIEAVLACRIMEEKDPAQLEQLLEHTTLVIQELARRRYTTLLIEKESHKSIKEVVNILKYKEYWPSWARKERRKKYILERMIAVLQQEADRAIKALRQAKEEVQKKEVPWKEIRGWLKALLELHPAMVQAQQEEYTKALETTWDELLQAIPVVAGLEELVKDLQERYGALDDGSQLSQLYEKAYHTALQNVVQEDEQKGTEKDKTLRQLFDKWINTPISGRPAIKEVAIQMILDAIKTQEVYINIDELLYKEMMSTMHHAFIPAMEKLDIIVAIKQYLAEEETKGPETED